MKGLPPPTLGQVTAMLGQARALSGVVDRCQCMAFIPTRKALDIDMIEERSSFAGEILRLDADRVRIHGGADLERADGGFLLPISKGRLLLEAPGWFAAKRDVGDGLPA